MESGMLLWCIHDGTLNSQETIPFPCSAKTITRRRKDWGLEGTRKQSHNVFTIHPFIQEIRKRFPRRGARKIRDQLWFDYNMRVPRCATSKLSVISCLICGVVATPRDLIITYLKYHEPHAVARRARGRFRRRRAWTAGVHDVWAMDQHDKWGRFHLWLHGAVEIHSGSQLWLKVWKGNRNPRLIVSYYLQAGRRLKGQWCAICFLRFLSQVMVLTQVQVSAY